MNLDTIDTSTNQITMKIGSISYCLFLYKSRVNVRGLCPIYCKICYNNEVKLISTSISVASTYWDSRHSTVVNSDLESCLLEVWKQKLNMILVDIYVNNLVPDLHAISAKLSNKPKLSEAQTEMGFLEVFRMFNGIASEKIGKSYNYRSVQKFTGIYNTVVKFIKAKYNISDLKLREIKLKHLLDYEEYCLLVLNHKQITINKAVQRLKQVIKYSIGHDYLDKDPWLLHQSKTATITIRYLQKDQLAMIETATNLGSRLEKIRDCFIFCCYTGLGYAELEKLSVDDVSTRNGISWITMFRKKTSRKFSIPILPPAEKLWVKYNGKLPVISNQKLNTALKEIAEKIGLNINLTTHLARKTFTSTVLLGNNIPLKVASTLLGHSNTKTTEKHYAEVSNDLLEQHVGALFDIFK